MKQKTSWAFCEICDSQLVLNYSDRGRNSGICDECGAMYTYELGDSGVGKTFDREVKNLGVL